MFCDFNAIKRTTVKGESTAQIPSFNSPNRTFVWWDQHNENIYNGDTKLRGSGCASCATLAITRAYSNKYGKTTPYEWRHKYQQKMFGHMRMPWHPEECDQVLRSAGLRTEYRHNDGLAECYKAIKNHLSLGMPVLAWVYAWSRSSKKYDYKYTNYVHTIALVGITKNDEAVILDSSRNGPLWKSDLKDVCNHILPGNWLHGYILVHPDTLYRVRRYWSDVTSQVGAYSLLENAKAKVEELHKMGETYTVYDWAGVPVWPLYRVRKDPNDMETQLGAYAYFKNAAAECELHPGHHVVNLWDDVLMTATEDIRTPVKVKIKAGAKIFDEPGKMGIAEVDEVDNDGIYTIVEIKEHDGTYYGRLKSEVGWVCMDDVRANI